MAIEIVDFPIKNGGSFQFAMLVYQRVEKWSKTPGSFLVSRGTTGIGLDTRLHPADQQFPKLAVQRTDLDGFLGFGRKGWKMLKLKFVALIMVNLWLIMVNLWLIMVNPCIESRKLNHNLCFFPKKIRDFKQGPQG